MRAECVQDADASMVYMLAFCVPSQGPVLTGLQCLQFITHPGEEQRSYTASPKKPAGQELPGLCAPEYIHRSRPISSTGHALTDDTSASQSHV